MALRTRRKRRQTRGKFRLYAPRWIDPHPGIPGTEPEKRVFAALLDQLHIYFIYQGQVPEFEKGNPMYFLTPPNYKPDFVLPEYRIIIDPFGVFHHSMKDAAKRDKRKIAAYSAAGYAYYHPWTGVPGTKPGDWVWDQRHDLVNDEANLKIRRRYGSVQRNQYGKLDRSLKGRAMSTLEMLMDIPEIRRGPLYPLTDPRDIQAKKERGFRMGQYVGAGANSVAAANRNRRKPPKLTLRARR